MRHVIVIGPLVIGALPTLAILEIAFNEAWGFASGGAFDQKATRDALAELIMSLAAEGETDPKRLKELALADLPRALETQ